jgi:hypothetical protein
MRALTTIACLLWLAGCLGSDPDEPKPGGACRKADDSECAVAQYCRCNDGSTPPCLDASNTEVDGACVYEDWGRRKIDPITPKILALTFDDGPGEYTRGIIDVLVKHKAKATFFMMGKNMAGRRDVLEYALDQGQQVASHSFYHLAQPTLSEKVFKHRLEAVKLNIGDRDGGRLFFRFPYGAAGEEQLRWIREADFDGDTYKVVGWNLDSQDWDFGQTCVRKGCAPEQAGGVTQVCSTAILGDSASCEDSAGKKLPNPFGGKRSAAGSCTEAGDYVGWTQYVARMKTGGVMLFHDIQRITSENLDTILTYLAQPSKYWADLKQADPTRHASYQAYYKACGVDPNIAFSFRALHSGPWPTYKY